MDIRVQSFVASLIYSPNYFAFEYGALSLILAGVSDTSALVCIGLYSVIEPQHAYGRLTELLSHVPCPISHSSNDLDTVLKSTCLVACHLLHFLRLPGLKFGSSRLHRLLPCRISRRSGTWLTLRIPQFPLFTHSSSLTMSVHQTMTPL